MIEAHEFGADSESNHSPESNSKHCIFQVRDSLYAISVLDVREVTLAPPLVRVPSCPPTLAGLCHIRSEFVPVVLLAPLLGDSDARLPAQLLVLNDPLGPWALMIDRAIAIDTIEMHVDAEHRDESHRSPVMGTATYQSEIIRVLDPQTLHQLVQQSRNRCWQTSSNSETASTEALA